MEVVGRRPDDPPGRPGGAADEQCDPGAGHLVGPAGERDDGQCHEQRLGDHEGERRRERPVGGGEGGDQRVEVVAEQVVAGPLERDDRGPAVRVRPDGLFEDAQVVGLGEDASVAVGADADVERGEPRGQAPGQEGRVAGEAECSAGLECSAEAECSRQRGRVRSGVGWGERGDGLGHRQSTLSLFD